MNSMSRGFRLSKANRKTLGALPFDIWGALNDVMPQPLECVSVVHKIPTRRTAQLSDPEMWHPSIIRPHQSVRELTGGCLWRFKTFLCADQKNAKLLGKPEKSALGDKCTFTKFNQDFERFICGNLKYNRDN